MLIFQLHHGMEEDESTAVYSYDHFLVELHQLGNGPYEHGVHLHIPQVERILGCRVAQLDIRVTQGKVDKHTQFPHDGHLLLVQSKLKIM